MGNKIGYTLVNNAELEVDLQGTAPSFVSSITRSLMKSLGIRHYCHFFWRPGPLDRPNMLITT